MDPTRAVDATRLAGAAHDLSIGAMFLNADWIVKLVMIVLLIASVWSWAIIFEKVIRLRKLAAAADQFEDSFWSGGSLDTLYERVAKKVRDPMASVFAAGMREWKLASERGGTPSQDVQGSLSQRIDRVMAVTIAREMSQVERSMTVLATVGSTSPFVGLFGTVWGIMNSFNAIAASQNTNLAVVAPGIAEALFATALGLVAAIPAVVAYNKFSNDVANYGDRLDAFSSEFSAILSRHLEEKH
jgi:biopolymer transport protein TolQ